jgi:hypothetical protein
MTMLKSTYVGSATVELREDSGGSPKEAAVSIFARHLVIRIMAYWSTSTLAGMHFQIFEIEDIT